MTEQSTQVGLAALQLEHHFNVRSLLHIHHGAYRVGHLSWCAATLNRLNTASHSLLEID